jgi:chromate transporter
MQRGSALEVLGVSLRLGLMSFGGPVAHLGYQREAFVARRAWLDDASLAEIVALCQTLPGPASTQLMTAVGRLRAGWAGALGSWVGFTLPSAIIMTIAGLWVTGGQLPDTGPVAGAIAGLKVAAVAVVAQAVILMARRLAPDAPRALIAIVAGIVALAMPTPVTQVALIAGGAVLGRTVLHRLAAPDAATAADLPLPAVGGRRTAVAMAAAFLVVVVGPQVIALVTGSPDARFYAALVRAGSLVFGGGHVVLPLLDAGVVAPGWVTPDAFLAGYGVAQALPGPLFTFATYLGVVATAGPGGAAGGILATLAIFLPGVLLVLAALPVLGALRRRPNLRSTLDGVNAAVVGLLAAALVDPVATGGITSPLSAVLAAIGAILLLVGRLPPIAVVAGCAAAMALAAA